MNSSLKYSLILTFLLIKINIPAQTTKPTKAFTIKYIVEKLNENCKGEIMQRGITFPDGEHYYTAFHFKNYSIVEKNSTAYIIIKRLFETKKMSDNSDKLSETSIEIPVNKIHHISFFTSEKKETANETNAPYRCMMIATKGENIVLYNIEKDETSHTTMEMIPSFVIENELKLKNAIQNLQTFYKQESDPFGN